MIHITTLNHFTTEPMLSMYSDYPGLVVIVRLRNIPRQECAWHMQSTRHPFSPARSVWLPIMNVGLLFPKIHHSHTRLGAYHTKPYHLQLHEQLQHASSYYDEYLTFVLSPAGLKSKSRQQRRATGPNVALHLPSSPLSSPHLPSPTSFER